MDSRPLAIALLVVCAAAAIGLAVSAWQSDSGTAARLVQIRDAAGQARTACFPRIHHDTHAFEACLLEQYDRNAATPARQLGIAYFGWVGAMNSARMGMIGAAAAANRFRQRFAVLQQSLGINDKDLCSSVPGDCQVRTAQLESQRSAEKNKGNGTAIAESTDSVPGDHRH